MKKDFSAKRLPSAETEATQSLSSWNLSFLAVRTNQGELEQSLSQIASSQELSGRSLFTAVYLRLDVWEREREGIRI